MDYEVHPRETRRTLWRIADPFLAWWWRYVEPDRSRLGARLLDDVEARIREDWRVHLGAVLEDLARASVPRLTIDGTRFGPASRWWGRATGGRPLELDLVAEAIGDPGHVLVGEAKLGADAREVAEIHASLARNAAEVPELRGRRVTTAVWTLGGAKGSFGAEEMLNR